LFSINTTTHKPLHSAKTLQTNIAMNDPYDT